MVLTSPMTKMLLNRNTCVSPLSLVKLFNTYGREMFYIFCFCCCGIRGGPRYICVWLTREIVKFLCAFWSRGLEFMRRNWYRSYSDGFKRIQKVLKGFKKFQKVSKTFKRF